MFRTFALAVAAALAAAPALADWQPSGPIKLMIAFRAGGGADTQARLIAEGIEAKRGWKIIPENVTGKGGVVLAQQLKDEPADGLTIAMAVTETLSYNRLAQRDPGFAPEDFTLLTATAGSQMAVVATADKGWKTLGDVIAAAKAGESVSFGAMSPKLADGAYLIGKANGVDFNIVGGLKGGRGVMNALTAGDVDVGWGAGIQTAGVVAGDLVNLASAEGAPLNASPDAPLLEEVEGVGERGNDPPWPSSIEKVIDELVNSFLKAMVEGLLVGEGGVEAEMLEDALGGMLDLVIHFSDSEE
ncbi:MAG: tripartite tricarboxylate transporter substrate-binding protein [Pseudomonadota bacterium]